MRSEISSLFLNERKAAVHLPLGELPAFIQVAVAWGELLGGAALLIGLFTRLASAGLIAIQVGAVLTVTWFRGFSFADGGGYEFNLALIAMCLSVLIMGGGMLSVDGMRRARKKPRVAADVPARA
jgi:uncharacterized membrane protein YphA (DoxX/SURF4 family)